MSPLLVARLMVTGGATSWVRCATSVASRVGGVHQQHQWYDTPAPLHDYVAEIDSTDWPNGKTPSSHTSLTLSLPLTHLVFGSHHKFPWSLHGMTRHCQKSPNLSCPPQKFALLFEHIDSSARFITSCMSPHPIPGPLSFSYLCRPFQKYITCRRVQGGAPHLSLGP